MRRGGDNCSRVSGASVWICRGYLSKAESALPGPDKRGDLCEPFQGSKFRSQTLLINGAATSCTLIGDNQKWKASVREPPIDLSGVNVEPSTIRLERIKALDQYTKGPRSTNGWPLRSA